MRVPVAIVGGGLAGLHAGRLLNAAGIAFQLVEARDRLGGRILSIDETGKNSSDALDLGPAWFWPGMQPALAELTRELGLSAFAQNSDGDVLFERMSKKAIHRVQAMPQVPESMRLAGGMGALVQALADGLPRERLQLASRVTRLSQKPDGAELTITDAGGGSNRLLAEQVIVALPPRLLAATVAFDPVLDAATAMRWENTATWMASHAKFVALYDRPFWREQGLSGTAQSMVGPLVEIHDATTASGSAAIFGFVGLGAAQRIKLGEPALVRACVAQLGRLFGPVKPRATLYKDWAADPLTATEADQTGGDHPVPARSPWVNGSWAERLSLGGSETSMTEPSYLAGAIAAAACAVSDVRRRLKR